MSQHYSDPTRETKPTALPDVETFQMEYVYCIKCQSLCGNIESRAALNKCENCGHSFRAGFRMKSGWFWWSCFPGCLPDSEPNGPFDTEAEALADAREGVEE